ncbi:MULTISPECIES: MFS transporter [Clostridium]|uniref:MFS transporter n=1 Tax=Clostridium TaxID=1485 RepID=UPI0008262958|nr:MULTISPECIES: MFS transporter [Clostridium]PJI10491.1 MFS transporter [Clostridium sp. CT7]
MNKNSIRNKEYFKISLLLLSNGISSIGDYIYLVAINIDILKRTHSALLVSTIWAIPYITSILTKFWSGSVADRCNKKVIMILINILNCAVLILMVAFPNILIIYILMFLLNIGISIYNSISLPYITENISENRRKRFNSIRGMLTNGSVVIGPAVSGIILAISSASTAIIINAISFFISAFLLIFMPKYKIVIESQKTVHKNILKSLVDDWKKSYTFMIYENFKFAIFNFLAVAIIVIGVALDSQEVVFATRILNLSSSEYSILFMIAGVGYVLGSIIIMAFANKISTNNLLKFGIIFSALGFFIYSISNSLIMAIIGFIILGIFQSMFNTGYISILQEIIPIKIFGRILSSISFFQSILTIISIVCIGALSEYFNIRYVVVASTIMIFIFSTVMFYTITVNQKNETLSSN